MQPESSRVDARIASFTLNDMFYFQSKALRSRTNPAPRTLRFHCRYYRRNWS
jgi:hypothetical protein